MRKKAACVSLMLVLGYHLILSQWPGKATKETETRSSEVDDDKRKFLTIWEAENVVIMSWWR